MNSPDKQIKLNKKKISILLNNLNNNNKSSMIINSSSSWNNENSLFSLSNKSIFKSKRITKKNSKLKFSAEELNSKNLLYMKQNKKNVK